MYSYWYSLELYNVPLVNGKIQIKGNKKVPANFYVSNLYHNQKRKSYIRQMHVHLGLAQARQ